MNRIPGVRRERGYLMTKKPIATLLLIALTILLLTGCQPAQPVDTTKADKVASISYTSPKTPKCYTGSFDIEIDSEGRRLKTYSLPRFREGDILTVTDVDGQAVDYVFTFCEEDGKRYFINGNEKIPPYTLSRYSHQSKQAWTVGGDNFYTVELYGCVARVPVVLLETDVESMIFTPQTPPVIAENMGGEVQRDAYDKPFYRYRTPVNNGDKLTVTYKGGNVVEYTIVPEDGDHYLLSADGTVVDDEEIEVVDTQYDSHWQAGSNNHVYILYHGVKVDMEVTICSETCLCDKGYRSKEYFLSEPTSGGYDLT